MSMQKTIVLEEKDRWRIVRNEEYEPIEEMAKADPEYPDIKVTPGFNPTKDPPMVPVVVDYGKNLADIEHIVNDAIPGIIEKEKHCPICKEALNRMSQRPQQSTSVEPAGPAAPPPADAKLFPRTKLMPEGGVIMEMFKKRQKLRDMILPKGGL